MSTIPLATNVNANVNGTIKEDISKKECSVNIPDYSVLRQKNLEKINNYYTDLLDTYTSTYADFNTQLSSANVNDRTYANTKLKPTVENTNIQMINLNQNMIDTVNKDTDLILDQKNQLQERTKKSLIASISDKR